MLTSRLRWTRVGATVLHRAMPGGIGAGSARHIVASRTRIRRSTSREKVRLADRDLRHRPVLAVRGRPADRVDDLHPSDDSAERGMLRVQPIVVGDVYEELAPGRVWARVRHRDRPPGVPVAGRELVGDRVSGAAEPRALRVAALDHEARDDAVEDRAIVESLLDQLPEVPGGDRHRAVEEIDSHVAHRRLEDDRRHGRDIAPSYVKGDDALRRENPRAQSHEAHGRPERPPCASSSRSGKSYLAPWPFRRSEVGRGGGIMTKRRTGPGWSPEYRILVTFRVPLDFAFAWCTDYTPQDASLEGEAYERKIVERTRRRLLFQDLEESASGWIWGRDVVTLLPPNRWHMDGVGNRRDVTADYVLTRLPDTRR